MFLDTGKINAEFVGSCDFMECVLNEEYLMDKKKSIEKYKMTVDVRTNDDGFEPHVHIDYRNMTGCVKLESAEYFNHKPFHNLKFSSYGRKALNNFFQEKEFRNKHGLNEYMTHWEYAVFLWNRTGQRKVVSQFVQPDYTDIK